MLRYSKEHKFRPAASPVITETLKDGRTRLRGSYPTPTTTATPLSTAGSKKRRRPGRAGGAKKKTRSTAKRWFTSLDFGSWCAGVVLVTRKSGLSVTYIRLQIQRNLVHHGDSCDSHKPEMVPVLVVVIGSFPSMAISLVWKASVFQRDLSDLTSCLSSHSCIDPTLKWKKVVDHQELYLSMYITSPWMGKPVKEREVSKKVGYELQMHNGQTTSSVGYGSEQRQRREVQSKLCTQTRKITQNYITQSHSS